MCPDRLEPCYSKTDICRPTMVENFNERLRRGKVDISNAACLKDDERQWLIVAINRFNHAAFEDFGIREDQRRLKSNDGDAILPFTLPGDFRRPPYRRARNLSQFDRMRSNCHRNPVEQGEANSDRCTGMNR